MKKPSKRYICYGMCYYDCTHVILAIVSHIIFGYSMLFNIGYYWLFYHRLLLVIVDYSIISYCWLFLIILDYFLLFYFILLKNIFHCTKLFYYTLFYLRS
jgi:hypothetical protein